MATESKKSTKATDISELNVDDRVRKVDGTGPLGVVKDVRQEVTSTSGDSSEKEMMIKVLWDNGTLSYFSPEALELAK